MVGGELSFADVFGLFNGEELQAVASLKCYYGNWYMRNDVVRPEHRGQGLQRELIRERLEFLAGRTEVVKASIEPWNSHSINNYLALGFGKWKRKKLKDGRIVDVYLRAVPEAS